MALILNIETATTMCSVALARDGELLALKEINNGYTHAENLTVFIEELIQQAHVKFTDLDAIAISKGPGSYTGLRIGVSTAKGLCYGLGKPLISVSTLKHLSLTLSKGEGMLSHKPVKKEVRENEPPRFYTTDALTWNFSIINAKEGRRNPTEAEQIVWQHLRTKQLGVKFRRQHPVDKFIPDFICIEKKLIVEIDGKIHDFKKQEDKERTTILNGLGYTVIRFTNDEVVSDIDKVIKSINEELNSAKDTNRLDVTSQPLAKDDIPFGEHRANLENTPALRLEGEDSLSFGEGRGEVLLCPMLDARRMEVYCALYDDELNEINPVQAKIIDEHSFQDYLKNNVIYFFGDGAAKCREKIVSSNAIFIEGVVPSAAAMISFSEAAFNANKFEDVAYFEPYYLKDFVAGPKKGS